MTTQPQPKPPRVTITEDGGTLKAEYPWKTYRFMFEDGGMLDVVAIRDDSDLREAMLERHYGKKITDPRQGRIAGVAVMPEEKSVKRVTRRR